MTTCEDRAADMVESETARAARMAWWCEARFGLFIHWGLYAVPAGIYQGKPVDRVDEWLMGDGAWIMRDAHIPCAEYREFAKAFQPDAFDAETWVRLAVEAGMKYVVITSKHHDGFAMYPSRVSPWNIRDAAGWPRDPLRELAEACRKAGLRLGFYYSQAQDWMNGGAVWENEKWDPEQDRGMDEYIDRVAVPQVKELCSIYGEDVPAILWWDTPCDMNPERAEKLYRAAKSLKPDIVTNNRLGGGIPGDTETPEQVIPETGFPGYWETCMTLNDTWGYKQTDTNWKSTGTLIRMLVATTSKSGNFLLNVGPDSDGLIPDASVERLKEIGRWMKINSESIHGCGAAALPAQPWGKITAKENLLFFHIFDWPQDGTLIVDQFAGAARKAWLLADAEKTPLEMRKDGETLCIRLPADAPDRINSVLCVEIVT
jgi:alpha-L-fucosidase